MRAVGFFFGADVAGVAAAGMLKGAGRAGAVVAGVEAEAAAEEAEAEAMPSWVGIVAVKRFRR